MPYARELRPPKAASQPVKRRHLWCFMAAQEMTLVSPEMHEEFIFSYQKEIAESFGLVAYGCCEDLSRKIPMLRRLDNLRRIAVAPTADARACAEQAGSDYVLSLRPNPALMICLDFEPQRIAEILRGYLEAGKGCHLDITLKDVHTVQNRPERFKKWVQIARREIDRFYS